MPITGAEITAASRVLVALRPILRRPEPAEVLARRAELRAEIGRWLSGLEQGKAAEIVVVNYRKFDLYGRTDERLIPRGASDWFKAEVKGLHDRGLELYSAIEYVVIRRGKVFRVPTEDVPGARKVWVVGRIPYERIGYIDWDPDPGSGSPRFYVVYGWRRRPLREVVLYEDSGWRGHKLEVPARYRGEGGGPVKRVTRTIRNAHYNWELRRDETAS